MNQILRTTPATLEILVYQDGTLTDLDANPTLVITDANGTTVTAAPTGAGAQALSRVTPGELVRLAYRRDQPHLILGADDGT